MANNQPTTAFIYGAIQLVAIILAGVIGFYFTRELGLIPKAVIQLPDVFVSHDDYIHVLTAFFVGYLIQIALTNVMFKAHALTSMKRFAHEYIFYLFAYTTISLYLFLATTINYDPQFIAAIGLFSTIFYWLIALVILVKAKETSVGGFFFQLIKRFFSMSGVLALAFFFVPLLLGKAFSSDRDIANKITQIRIWFNPVAETAWGFKTVFTGTKFHQPVLARQAPNTDQHIFVLERFGKVYQMDLTQPQQPPELMLDLSQELGVVEMENGAIGLALHPEFGLTDSAKQYAYVYFTDTRPEGGIQHNRLSRYDLSRPTLAARKASEQVILLLDREDSGFHNGGSLEFGSDGYLYVAMGEGVRTPSASTFQDTFRSGILRLDVDMNTETSKQPNPFPTGIAKNYLVPKDNPFIGNPDVRDEFFALGLRNPFRMNFDAKTQQLWVGDVGSTIWEEVNVIEKGIHYEFPKVEGHNVDNIQSNELGLPSKGPIYTYQHTAYDRAVIGGVVNRSDYYDGLTDKYIFADNYSAKLFALDASKERVDEVEFLARANQYAQRGVSSVTQLRSGEIFITTLGAASDTSGEVLQLVKASEANVTAAAEEKKTTPKGYDEDVVAALYNVNCARCHGVKGDGDSPDAVHLGVPLPDFTSPLYHHKTSAEQMLEVIKKGGAQTGKSPLMPPWEGFLKPHELEYLVTYIQSLPDKHHSH
ncbi:hypothetical protein DXX93_00715 [Thalassotalea euphylliae]|uniref:Cytochrome c domain-containing protein n=1 Tax=Thalassotalea euphylliae TaxID=1655234 RepID=A0A3E0TM24_9GAMM|nr:PQQ-dependent sugar dehydrogenase [Thalassotalea euphylliae]REL25222.1 hypothetical protein DXX93_00715 [Thalassotalea euphylliae]